VYIDTSTIPNAGRGLFAKTSIKKGTVFLEYTGITLNKKQFNSLESDRDADYIVEYSATKFIDGRNEIGGMANTLLGKKKGFNAKFFKDRKQKKIFLKALSDIEEGDEILLYYGDQYRLPEQD